MYEHAVTRAAVGYSKLGAGAASPWCASGAVNQQQQRQQLDESSMPSAAVGTATSRN
jgi:hypothetical protein